MEKPIVIEILADNGEHSHWVLINPETGEKIWSEDPDECKAMGYPVEITEGFTEEDLKEFSEKMQEGYNRIVPEHLRNEENIDKEKEASFERWANKIHEELEEMIQLGGGRIISRDNYQKAIVEFCETHKDGAPITFDSNTIGKCYLKDNDHTKLVVEITTDEGNKIIEGLLNQPIGVSSRKAEDISKFDFVGNPPSESDLEKELEFVDYKGYRYWYEYKAARDRVDICLATKNPKEYCNGFYLYSTKDPGSGTEFVVVKTNDPDFKFRESF